MSVQNADGSRTSKKADFAIQLSGMVEANENTGYLADAKRAIDGKRKYVCATQSSPKLVWLVHNFKLFEVPLSILSIYTHINRAVYMYLQCMLEFFLYFGVCILGRAWTC